MQISFYYHLHFTPIYSAPVETVSAAIEDKKKKKKSKRPRKDVAEFAAVPAPAVEEEVLVEAAAPFVEAVAPVLAGKEECTRF